MEMGLILREARRAGWTGLDWDERVGMASLAACEAENAYDSNRGALSTLIVNSIRNSFRDYQRKEQTRFKYDGVQASCLQPSQIPAADTPDPERRAIFIDSLTKLPKDGQRLATMALAAPYMPGRDGRNVLRVLQDTLHDEGWSRPRFQQAVRDVREVL